MNKNSWQQQKEQQKTTDEWKQLTATTTRRTPENNRQQELPWTKATRIATRIANDYNYIWQQIKQQQKQQIAKTENSDNITSSWGIKNKPTPQKIQQPTQLFIMSQNVSSQFSQYQIQCDGTNEHCETRHLLTTIDTIEFPKWEQTSVASASGNIVTWVDVFGFEWMCFGCNVSALKHAPFCNNSQSYCRREANHFDPKISSNVLSFWHMKILFCCHLMKQNSTKRLLYPKNLQRTN